MKMPAITLWEPWATWVALEWKTIETRTHNRFASLVGQRIAIHAGQKFDYAAAQLARPFMEDWQKQEQVYTRSGTIACTAVVAEHRQLTAADSKAALIDCGSTRRWGLVLKDVNAYLIGIVVRGHQGIWEVELP